MIPKSYVENIGIYSVELANKIGIENACNFHLYLNGNNFIDKLKELTDIGLIDKDTLDVNYEKLNEILLGENINKTIDTLFLDRRYVNLIARYRELVLSRGRSFKENFLREKFSMEGLDRTLRALKRSVDNGWITLQFEVDERDKEDSGRTKSGGNVRHRISKVGKRDYSDRKI